MGDAFAADCMSRRAAAVSAAQAAAADLKRLGVEVKIIGSLASHDFGPSSDVDLLVVSCPQRHKYAIESLVEDRLGNLPFDVIYLDEVPSRNRDRLMAQAIDASDLR